MSYIINPVWFYIVNVVNGFRIASILLTIFMGIGTIVFIVGKGVMLSNEHYNRHDHIDSDYLDAKLVCQFTKIFTILFPISLLLSIFIPNKETIIEIMIGKVATVENAQWTIDALKEAVDYIAQTMLYSKAF